MKLLSGHPAPMLAAVTGLGGGELFARLASWGAFLYLLQVLPPTDYGLLGLASAAVNLFIPWVDLGWSTVGSREVAAEPGRARTWLRAITSRRTTIAFGLFVVVTAGAAQLSDRTLAGLVVGNSLYLFVGALTPDWYLAARQRIGLVSSARIVQGCLYLLFVMTFVRGPNDLLLQPLAGVASYAISIGVMAWGIGRSDPGMVKDGRAQATLRLPAMEPALVFGGAYTLQSMPSIALLLVGALAGADEGGYFNAGLRFWVLGSVIASLPAIVATPRLAAAVGDRSTRALTELWVVTGATALAMAAVGLLAAQALARTIAPPSYGPLGSVLLVLFLGIGAQTMSQSGVRALIVFQRTKEAVTSQFLGVIAGSLVLALLVDRAGAMAGALACVTAEMVAGLLAVSRLRGRMDDAVRWSKTLSTMIAPIGLAAAAAFIGAKVFGLTDLGTVISTGLIVGSGWIWTLRRHGSAEPFTSISGTPSIAVDAVVVSWNNGPWVDRSVRSLIASGVKARHIVVVETGQDRAAGRSLRQLPAGVRTMLRPDNPGYGAAVNAGAALLRSRHPLLVMNADVEMTPEALSVMRRTLDAWLRAGCVTVRTHDERGRDSTHTRRTTPTRLALMIALPGLWNQLRHLKSAKTGSTVQEVRFAEGSAFLIRRLAWEEMGGFDERFRFFGEDADLSTRLRKAGWRLLHAASTSILHIGRSSFGGRDLDVLPHLVRGLVLWTWTHVPKHVRRLRWLLRMAATARSMIDRPSAEVMAAMREELRDDKLRTSGEHAGMMKRKAAAEISVVVPTFDRPVTLRRCLKHLRPQVRKEDELIVVHQGRRAEGRRTSSPWLVRPHRGRAKNVAARSAEGVTLLFCDDDILPPDGFLEAHRAYQRLEHPRAVTCRMIEPQAVSVEASGPVLTIGRWGRVYTRFDHPERTRTGYAATGNMSVPRASFAATGGFDESYRGTGVFEEADLGERLSALGVPAWLEPTPTVEHRPDDGGNRKERDRTPKRYYYLFHHNLSYFYLKNRGRWPWMFAAVTALARSIRQTRRARLPWRDAIAMLSGYGAAVRTMREIRRP